MGPLLYARLASASVSRGWRAFLFDLTILAGVAALLVSGPAVAQDVPGSVDPGQLERRFERPPTPQAEPEAVVPRPEAEEQVPPEQAEQIRFVFSGLVLDGVTVYTEDELRPLYEEYLEREISLADLYAVADAITAKYRNDGYILSRAIVPPQTIEGGVARLRVVEGYIDKIEIEGDADGGRALIESFAGKIVNSRPLKAADLERYLLLTNDLPGVSASIVLASSEEAPGASTGTLVVRRDAVSGFASVDNRGSRYVGPYQGQLGTDFNGVLGMNERTRLRGITVSQTEELQFFEVEHEQQIGTEGTSLVAALRRTLSEPGYTLESLDVESESTSADLTVQHPFLRSRPESLYGHVTFSYRNSDTDILGSDFSEDRTRALRLGAAYDFVDRFRGITLIEAEVSQGLDVLNATETGSADLSRARGQSDFTKVTASASRLQSLTSELSLLATVSGQQTSDPLLAAEEFALGGTEFGRAYDPSEITGDRGAALRLEGRYDMPVEGRFPQAAQGYLFYDVGAVWNEDPDAGEASRQSLASAGVGLRFSFTPELSGSFEVALPLTREVAAEGDDGDDPRVFFELSASF